MVQSGGRTAEVKMRRATVNGRDDAPTSSNNVCKEVVSQ